jgi:hypothetical protein
MMSVWGKFLRAVYLFIRSSDRRIKEASVCQVCSLELPLHPSWCMHLVRRLRQRVERPLISVYISYISPCPCPCPFIFRFRLRLPQTLAADVPSSLQSLHITGASFRPYHPTPQQFKASAMGMRFSIMRSDLTRVSGIAGSGKKASPASLNLFKHDRKRMDTFKDLQRTSSFVLTGVVKLRGHLLIKYVNNSLLPSDVSRARKTATCSIINIY